MKNNCDRNLYIKTLNENICRTVMDKLFDKYSGYINYNIINTIEYNITADIYLYDPVYAFFDALCNKIIKENIANSKTVIYHIMSPYHKKEVTYGMLVTNNNIICIKLINLCVSKADHLYTIAFSETDEKYLTFSDNIFKNSNKIQQE